MTLIDASRITDENVEDVMETAAYGGITYWVVQPSEKDFRTLAEGHHLVRDDDDGKLYHLTPEMIRKAIVEVAQNLHTNTTIAHYVFSAFEDWTEEDGIECGHIDADAADCIVQVACFGKVIYG